MKLSKNRIYELALKISIGITLIGVLFKIQHYPGGNLLLEIGGVLSLVYIFIGIVDIAKDSSIDFLFKFLWILGFIVISPITGFIYYYSKIKIK